MTFTPDDGFSGPATFAYAVDDQQGHTVAGAVAIDVLAPSNRPPVATDTTLAVEAGTPTNIDLAALVTDPDAGDQLTYAISGPAEGAVTLSQSGATVQASAPIDAADRTDSFTYTATDSAGQSGRRHGGVDRAAAGRPAAAGPQRRGDDEPGSAGDDQRARQRHRPARSGPDGGVASASRRPARRRPTASR